MQYIFKRGCQSVILLIQCKGKHIKWKEFKTVNCSRCDCLRLTILTICRIKEREKIKLLSLKKSNEIVEIKNISILAQQVEAETF